MNNETLNRHRWQTKYPAEKEYYRDAAILRSAERIKELDRALHYLNTTVMWAVFGLWVFGLALFCRIYFG